MDKSYQLLAAKYVRRQARQLAEQLEGVRRAEDIEFVHRARVASRRLRAALRMFQDYFGRKQTRRWRKRIRRLATELGDARDRDVQIEFLCDVLGRLSDKECVAAIARLLVRLEHEREQLQPRVARAARKFAANRTLGQMESFTKEAVAEAKTDAVPLQSPFTLARLEEHLLGRFDDLATYEDSLDEPDDIERHHAMRIAAKRLRYTAEIARPVYAGRLDEFVAIMKRLQTLLGDLHDCDVWLAHLDHFAKEERRRTMAYYGHAERFERLKRGIAYLCDERVTQRCRVFAELVEYWRELRHTGAWERLAEVVRSRGASDDEGRVAEEGIAN